jgi:hypothetical protein
VITDVVSTLKNMVDQLDHGAADFKQFQARWGLKQPQVNQL